MMKSITPEELKKIMSSETLVLIDVREKWEREVFHIGGIHIPMHEVLARISEIPHEKDVVVYCEKGIRSEIIIQRLQEKGYKNLINLAGGLHAWKRNIL